MPATAVAILDAFGERVRSFDRRGQAGAVPDAGSRSRTGRYDVVVGTRAGGLRAAARPGTHRRVAGEPPGAPGGSSAVLPRPRCGAASGRASPEPCACSPRCARRPRRAALGVPAVAPSTRRWPPVEVVRAGPEGRAPRLVRALRETRRGFIFAPLPGYGIAQVCRSCGRPAACAACGGLLRSEEGVVRCVVCEAPGRCAHCGATDFGIRRGGAERVEEWASIGRAGAGPAGRHGRRARCRRRPRSWSAARSRSATWARRPRAGGAILDADLAERRPGLAARERALATWMEAVGWARPGAGPSCRPTARTIRPSRRWCGATRTGSMPTRRDAARAAGFPVGAAVFRIAGIERARRPRSRPATRSRCSSSSVGEQTVCLLALEPGRVGELGRMVRELAARDVVTRVEAEPHL